MPASTVPMINFLPWREVRQLRRRQRFCVTLVAVVAMSLATVAGAVIWATSMVSERVRDNADLQAAMDALQQRITQQDAVFIDYREQQGDFADTRRLHAARLQQTRLLTEVSAMMSNGLALTQLRYELSTVQLLGSARSAQHVSDLLQLLRQRSGIASAELQALSLDKAPDSVTPQDYFYRLGLQLSPTDLDFMVSEGDG